MLSTTTYEGDPQSWSLAREYVGPLKKVPPLFSTTVRTLMVDVNAGSETISTGSMFLLSRLLRGPTMKALFYYATLTFHRDRVVNTPYLSSPQLIRYFSPGELAGMVAAVYIYRRLKREFNDDEWQLFSRPLLLDIELGTLVGNSMPAVGAMSGVLAGSMRHFAMMLFRLNNSEKFENYQEHLARTGLAYDNEFEFDQWGCTSQQVAGVLLQNAGFGIALVNSFNLCQCLHYRANVEADKLAYGFHTAFDWISELREHGQIPDRTHLGEYYPLENLLHKLMYKVSELRAKGSEYSWLDRGKEDISPDRTPQLYQEALMEAQSSAALQEFFQENLPSEVLEGLSDQELAAISSVDGDDIVE